MYQLSVNRERLGKAARVSYLFVAVALILIGWLHLGPATIAALFAYLALTKLHPQIRRGRALAVILFLILLAGLAYAIGYVVNQSVRVLPEVADQAIPSVLQWAKHYSIELPFTDYDSLKELALESVKSQVQYLGSFARFARGATTQFLFVVVGLVIAIGLFLNPRIELERASGRAPNNLYSVCCAAIAERFRTFFQSFATVMGAQVIISAINTVLTSIFVVTVHLDYAAVVIGATFLCGLVPVVGNLVSNSIVVGVAITMSPRLAVAALIFLVVIHKLEYFLNSKIVGERIRNPFWLTLLALIVGERLMGIPGMVLAPVVLNYIKLEASRIEVDPVPERVAGSNPEAVS
jgi:predicted PurR-regulated permease PerM